VRHQAIVVGEDLGTVPPEVPPALERWKVLTSKVLYFETGEDGGFRPPAAYPRYTLATVNTHDMAPLAGWFDGRDLKLRAAAGYMSEDDLARALDERARTARRLRERLAADGLLPSADAPASDAELRGAVHAFLLETPAMLVGVSLDDLAGETEPVNMPGLGAEEYASWTRRLRRSIAELRDDPEVRVALGVRAGAGGAGSAQR
jgi:4-alpha-glucanotransferase